MRGWIVTNKHGTTIHISEHNGWKVEEVVSDNAAAPELLSPQTWDVIIPSLNCYRKVVLLNDFTELRAAYERVVKKSTS